MNQIKWHYSNTGKSLETISVLITIIYHYIALLRRIVQQYIKNIEPKVWKDLVEYLFDDEVLEDNHDASEILIVTNNGVKVTALQLPLLYQNKFRVAIMPGVENHGIRWILIIKIDYSQDPHHPKNEVFSLLKNPTPGNIRELNIHSK